MTNLHEIDCAQVSFTQQHNHFFRFSAGCGHCKQLAPTYEKVAAAFAQEPNVVVAAVDATKHSALAQSYDVTGYPSECDHMEYIII